jgi:hypothetical protein
MKLWRVEEYRMQLSKGGFACHMEERKSEHPMIRAQRRPTDWGKVSEIVVFKFP